MRVRQDLDELEGKQIVPRHTVKWFAEEMEAKLQDNDHKGGWSDESIEWLQTRMYKNYRDLVTSTLNLRVAQEDDRLSAREIDRLVRDCADVANRAMMIADNAKRMV